MAKRSVFDEWLNGNEAVLGRFASAPGDWQAALNQRNESPARPWLDDEREELLAYNQAIGAPEAVLSSIARLMNPSTRVIVTGQQTGLALGPLYTLYKALGAIGHAQQMEMRTGMPVVPCFWVASEDHDFEEVRDLNWIGRDGERQSFRYEPQFEVNGYSMREVPVEPGLQALIDQVDRTTIDSEFKSEVLDWLRHSFVAGQSLEQSFGKALMGLLGRYGIVALSPYLLRFRRQAAALFERELSNPSASSRAVIDAARLLINANCAPGLHREPFDINFFIYEDHGRRCKLSWRGDRIHVENCNGYERETSPAELLEEVRANPTRISTNVISRPVCQDAALNSIAYIAGPGELTYFAQLREVYELWNTPMPLIVLRPRAVLIDGRVRRFLEKASVTLNELLSNSPQDLEKKVIGETSELQAINQAREQAVAIVQKLGGTLGAISPAIQKAIDRLAESQDKAMRTIEERVNQELKQRNEAQLKRLRRVEEWLRPDGLPQERIYSVISPLLINHGMRVIDHLLEQLDLGRTDVQVVEV